MTGWCRIRCCRKRKPIVDNTRYGNLQEGEECYVMQSSEDNEAEESESAEEDGQTEDASKKTRFHKLIALFNYKKLFSGDLDFKKDDIMLTTAQSLDGWIEAIHSETGETGFVPGNYVRFDDGKPENLDAFQDVDRLTAEKKLFLPGHSPGTYLIRKRGDKKGYAISVLVWDKTNCMNQVQHYQINTPSNGKGYYVNRNITFASVKRLIEHYSSDQNKSNLKLILPCPRKFHPPVQFRDFEVDRKCITLGRKLGNGEFGEVFEAKYNNQLPVAVKRMLNKTTVDSFIAEAKAMHRLHHPRIVQLLGVCTEPADQPLLIILELLPRGSLLEYLRIMEPNEITLQDQVLWMTQISEGMKYLEANHFIHRDLRAANVLVDRDCSVKVADFGLARILQNSLQYAAKTAFPVRWTAPESATGDHVFSVKSDVWSFGVVMYEILSKGGVPYQGIGNNELMAKLIGGFRLPNPLPASNADGAALYELMQSCWQADPRERPSFNVIHQKFCMWNFTQ